MAHDTNRRITDRIKAIALALDARSP